LQWWTGECHGAAHVLELREARWLEPYVGERQPRQYRAARTLRAMVRERNAAAGVNASFFWADRRGRFMVLGHVAQNGVPLVSPNADVLRWQRCYLATTWDGRFVIGATNLTTGKLLRQRPELRHVVGGGGWLVRDGSAKAWRDAETQQGFREDITKSLRQRTAVAVSADGRAAWLVTFDGQVSLCDCAAWLARELQARNALFFDGGETATLVTSDVTPDTAHCSLLTAHLLCALNRPRPRFIPVALLVRTP
jgi:exopolysaccharide biosynthesis protein